LDLLFELGLPGLVFLGLFIWLIRKLIKAARTEQDLEGHRLQGTLAEELAAGRARAAGNRGPSLHPAPEPEPAPDLAGATPAHLALISSLIPRDALLLWARSTPTHAVWCERRRSGDVLCVARIESGQVLQRWSFG
jgi:hypothetical protein